MTANYTGMSRESGRGLNDLEHISQSVRDILITPIGSRVMRRDYGSLLSALIDQPQSPAVNGQVMAACYMAILKWESRIRLLSITFEKTFTGQMFVEITGVRQDTTGGTFSLTVPLS
ncbi:GPW/gp25 family protein [Serratia sp. IR-2025]